MLFRKFTKKRTASAIEPTPFYDSYIKDVDEALKSVITNPDSSINQIKLQASQRFHEFVWRLDQRFRQLKTIEALMHAKDLGKDIPFDSHKIQLEFVNRTEAYYQQLYATLSAFAMFVNLAAPHEFKRGLPISGIKEFLAFLKGKTNLGISEAIDALEVAREFRAKFVDHIQQHTLHDWMTAFYPVDGAVAAVVIYFIRNDDGIAVHVPVHRNPYAPDFVPPVSCKSFYVSPSQNISHKSLFKVCLSTIKALKDSVPSTSENLLKKS